METALLIQPLLVGLSVGAFCLTYCFPFMGSFITAEERPLKKNFFVVLEFLLGRLVGYLCFGLLAGYLGKRFDSEGLRFATNISYIFLSIILALYLAGLIKKTGIFCYSAKFLKGKSPFILGFFMGVNLCPPFLLSVAYVMDQQSVLYGILYFALFFLASSVYFLPLVFMGMLSRVKEFQTAARLSGFLVAAIFFVYGVYSLLHNNLL